MGFHGSLARVSARVTGWRVQTISPVMMERRRRRRIGDREKSSGGGLEGASGARRITAWASESSHYVRRGFMPAGYIGESMPGANGASTPRGAPGRGGIPEGTGEASISPATCPFSRRGDCHCHAVEIRTDDIEWLSGADHHDRHGQIRSTVMTSRGKLAKKMTSQQIADAQQRATDWLTAFEQRGGKCVGTDRSIFE